MNRLVFDHLQPITIENIKIKGPDLDSGLRISNPDL